MPNTQYSVQFTPLQTYTRHNGDKDSLRVDVKYPSGNTETLEIADNLFILKFNAADDYRMLSEASTSGKLCTATIYGWRNSLLSMFETIEEVTCE